MGRRRSSGRRRGKAPQLPAESRPHTGIASADTLAESLRTEREGSSDADAPCERTAQVAVGPAPTTVAGHWAWIAAATWLLLAVSTYAWVSLPALVKPGYLGAKHALPVLALVALAGLAGLVVGLSGSPSLARLHLRLASLGIAALAGLVAVGGEVVLAFAVTAWILLLCWALGDRLLSLLFRPTQGPAGGLRHALSAMVGIGIAGHTVLAAGLLGLLTRWFFLALLVAATLALRRRVLAGLARAAGAIRTAPSELAATRWRWYHPCLWSLLAAWVGIGLIQAAAPEIQYDSLNYHLNLPRIWIEAGSIFSTPSTIQSYYYLGAEAGFTLAMLLGGQAAAKLLSFSVGALTCVALYSTSRALGSGHRALVSLSLFAACPLVAWQASTTYVDMFLTCYCLLAVSATLRWLDGRDPRWLLLAGSLAGLALSTKLTASMFLVPLAVAVLADAVFCARGPAGRRLTPLLLFAAGTVAAGFPWPLLRLVQTGNPIFPFLNTVFRSPLAPATSSLNMFAIFGVGTSLKGLARLPWALSFEAGKLGEALPPSVIGACLLLVPMALLLRRVSRPYKVVAFVSLAYVGLWAFTAQYMRYLLPALPGACLLAALALDALEDGASRITRAIGAVLVPGMILLHVLCGFPAYAASFYNISERVPWKVAFGLESRDDYIARTVPAVAAFRFLATVNERTPVRLLVLGDESRLYFPGEMETMSSPCMTSILAAGTPQEAADVLRSQGFTHIVLNRNKFPVPPPWLNVAQDGFLDRHTDILFAARNFELYALLERPRAATSTLASAGTERVRNGSLERPQGDAPEGWQRYGNPVVDCSGRKSLDGRCAVLVSATAGFTQHVQVTPGKLYTLIHSSRSDDPESVVRGQVNWVDAKGRLLDAIVLVWKSTPEWTSHNLRQTAPTGATGAVVHVSSHTGEVWLDSVSLRER